MTDFWRLLKIKVALCVPNTKLKFNDACAPLNLGYIASYLRKHAPDVEVKIFDGMTNQNVKELLLGFRPDVVGVTAVTPQAPSAYALLDWVRTTLGYYVYTVIGGVHASALPDEASQHADTVVIGEGELAFKNIVINFSNGERSAKVFQGVPLDDLDEIPSPAFELIDMTEYLKHGPPFPGLNGKIMSMVTSRGCPFKCVFCHNSSRTSKVRYFSALRIVEEILYFKAKYGIDCVFFNDDEFLINRKRLEELAVLFKKFGVDKWLKWGCQVRVNTLSVDLLKLAKSMGCVVISPGFESCNQRVLDYLKCSTTKVEANERALKIAKETGVIIGGSFIFGSPSETLAEMKENFAWFVKHRDLKFIGINTLIPYPGTQVFCEAQIAGLLPAKVDYEQLIPTSVPSQTYVVNREVSFKRYDRFVVGAQRVAWLLTQLRLGKGFWGLARFKTWWWVWLHHPKLMMSELFYSLTANSRTKKEASK